MRLKVTFNSPRSFRRIQRFHPWQRRYMSKNKASVAERLYQHCATVIITLICEPSRKTPRQITSNE